MATRVMRESVRSFCPAKGLRWRIAPNPHTACAMASGGVESAVESVSQAAGLGRNPDASSQGCSIRVAKAKEQWAVGVDTCRHLQGSERCGQAGLERRERICTAVESNVNGSVNATSM